MKEIELGDIVINEELNIGNIELDIKKITGQNPIELKIVPSEQIQVFSNVNGYSPIEVDKINTDSIMVKSTEENQLIKPTNKYYNEILVEKIKSEEINVIPTTENQTILPSDNNDYIKKVNVNKINLQEKEITPTTETQEIINDISYDGLNKVIITGVTSSIDENVKSENIKNGTTILGVEGNVVELKGQEKEITPTIATQIITPNEEYNALTKVTINAVSSEIDSNIKSENIKDGVSILGVNGSLQELKGEIKQVEPTTTTQIVTPSENYNGIVELIVNAVTNSIDENIKSENIKKDISILGITGTLEEKEDQGWKPRDDWYDIVTILDNDEENYPSKMIMLLNDSFDTLYIKPITATKIKFSDGNEVDTSSVGASSTITYTFNNAHGKECSEGYKTRYAIFYFSNTNIITQPLVSHDSEKCSIMYLYIKNMTINSSTFFSNCKTLQFVKTLNCQYLNNQLILEYDYYLYGFDGIRFTGIKTINLRDCVKLDRKKLNIDWSTITSTNFLFYKYDDTDDLILPQGLDLSKITIFSNMFNNALITYLDRLDLSSATNVGSMFTGSWIIEIGKITGTIKINLEIKNLILNKNTLLKFLNALYDYSSVGGTHTLTIGSTNLGKLTDAEKLIATNKGWTLA